MSNTIFQKITLYYDIEKRVIPATLHLEMHKKIKYLFCVGAHVCAIIGRKNLYIRNFFWNNLHKGKKIWKFFQKSDDKVDSKLSYSRKIFINIYSSFSFLLQYWASQALFMVLSYLWLSSIFRIEYSFYIVKNCNSTTNLMHLITSLILTYTCQIRTRT